MMYPSTRFATTLRTRFGSAAAHGCACLMLLSLLILMGSLAGCGKSPASKPATQSAINNRQSAILTLHWLGKKRLTAESNATNFVSIWNMPESLRLEGQTLDKLATAPWRLLTTATPLSNAPSALLRPLLDDLVQEESYLEISAATNQPAEIVLAIKLPPDRAALWQTNLPAIFDSLQPTTYNLQPATNINGWTLLSIHSSNNPAIQQSSNPTINIASRLSTTGLPFATEATNFWISGRADLSALSHIAGWNIRSNTQLPVCEFSAIGDGTNVRSLATLTFPSKATIELEPWNIPTNLIVEPIAAVAFARSVDQVCSQIGILSPAQTTIIPKQFSLWQRIGAPVQIHFATPVTPSLSVLLDEYVPKFAERVNSYLDHRKGGYLTLSTNGMLIRWDGLMLAAPYFRVTTNETSQHYHAAFGLLPPRSKPISKELYDHALGSSNTVYFEWEHTSSTLPNWRYLDDASRMIFDNAHVSRLNSGHASIDWIKSNLTNLSHSITKLSVEEDGRFSFSRKSTVGLNGFELAILAHWLETAQFPSGFDTLWKTNPAPFNVRFRRGNANAPANN